MRIAIDIPIHFPPVWKIASGALDYETEIWRHNRAMNATTLLPEVSIILPNASHSTEDDRNPENWDGIIARKPRADFDGPQVFISSDHMDKGVSVTVSHDAIVRLVVDKFLSMGLRSMAFFGNSIWAVSRDRWTSFSHYVKTVGIDPVLIESPDHHLPREALLKLRKPCGVMAFNDGLAFRLYRICDEIGLQVARDVHVISVDDLPACLKSSPTLSSVSMSFGLVGYHAAQLCAQMIQGESVESMQIPPSGLIVRDSINVGDEDIRTAAEIAHYLRANLSYPIQMEDVVRRSSISRRRLEQVFRSAYGVSPMAYLKDCRFEQAKELLRSSDSLLKDIVKECGYTNSIQLCHIFKKNVGLSPMAYRKKMSQ